MMFMMSILIAIESYMQRKSDFSIGHTIFILLAIF